MLGDVELYGGDGRDTLEARQLDPNISLVDPDPVSIIQTEIPGNIHKNDHSKLNENIKHCQLVKLNPN